MKKGFSIVVVVLLLAATFHVTVATHFCGGRVAESIVSISGRLASCGMESTEKKPVFPGTNFANHCCDDIVTSCMTDNNYKPSFTDVHESSQYDYQAFPINPGSPFYPGTFLDSLSLKAKPPGEIMSASVDLPDICVFRI